MKKNRKKETPEAIAKSAACYYNCAVARILSLNGKFVAPWTFKEVQEIMLCNPTAADVVSAIETAETYLAANSEINERFCSVIDGNGCTGRMLLDNAKAEIAKINA